MNYEPFYNIYKNLFSFVLLGLLFPLHHIHDSDHNQMQLVQNPTPQTYIYAHKVKDSQIFYSSSSLVRLDQAESVCRRHGNRKLKKRHITAIRFPFYHFSFQSDPVIFSFGSLNSAYILYTHTNLHLGLLASLFSNTYSPLALPNAKLVIKFEV